MKHNKTHKLVFIALFTALALILSYLEALIPIPLPIPGAKLGLTNIVTLISLCTLGSPLTLLIIVARIFLSGFLFSGLSTILYSLSGGLLSLSIMILLLKIPKVQLSIITISIVGAVCHNLGQLIIAAAVVQSLNLFLYYLPFLMLLAIPTGLVVGIISQMLLKRLNIFL